MVEPHALSKSYWLLHEETRVRLEGLDVRDAHPPDPDHLRPCPDPIPDVSCGHRLTDGGRPPTKGLLEPLVLGGE